MVIKQGQCAVCEQGEVVPRDPRGGCEVVLIMLIVIGVCRGHNTYNMF